VSPEGRENKSASNASALVFSPFRTHDVAAEGGGQIDAGLHGTFVRFMASW
jgi:hypothetical protein